MSEYNERGAKTEQMGSDGTNFLSLLIGMEGSNSLIGEEERIEKSDVKSSLYISSKKTNSPNQKKGERKRRERKVM